jgi:hypothetical protein
MGEAAARKEHQNRLVTAMLNHHLSGATMVLEGMGVDLGAQELKAESAHFVITIQQKLVEPASNLITPAQFQRG